MIAYEYYLLTLLGFRQTLAVGIAVSATSGVWCGRLPDTSNASQANANTAAIGLPPISWSILHPLCVCCFDVRDGRGLLIVRIGSESEDGFEDKSICGYC